MATIHSGEEASGTYRSGGTIFAGLVAGAAAILIAIVPARAECTGEWQSGFGFPGGLEGQNVYAGQVFDDGTGPALYMGGVFTNADGTRANNIARWDGRRWSPLPGGASPGVGSGGVLALVVHAGELIVAGGFTQAGGQPATNIAAWNGSSWHTLGAGIGSTAEGVFALASYKGDLIAGGTFTSASGNAANRIARWNGAEWRPLGAGVTGHVRALTVHDGSLIAGGTFNSAGGLPAARIARWDGQNWSPLGAGMASGFVYALTTYQGEIIAGGTFAQSGVQQVNRVARWNGESWLPLGEGAANGANGEVRALAQDGDLLLVGGRFSQVGGQPSISCAAWNGSSWISRPLPSLDVEGIPRVDAIAVYNGEAYAAGLNEEDTHNLTIVRRWNGSSWERAAGARGADLLVRALYSFEDDLFVAGDFWAVGNVIAHRVARLDQTQAHSLPDPITGRTTRPFVSFVGAITSYDGEVVMGGSPNVNSPVAAWTGTHWKDLGSPGFPEALELYNGELIAAVSNGPRRLKGANWITLDGPNGSGVVGNIYALEPYQGKLAVGGAFLTAGGEPANRIALWDGATWYRLGTPEENGVNERVEAMLEFEGDLIVAGRFSRAGNQPAERVARWDGAGWHAMSISGNPLHRVNALARHHGTLFAGGFLQITEPEPINGIARWDGNAWRPVPHADGGEGVDGEVHTLAVHKDQLYVGGMLYSAAVGRSAGPISATRIGAWRDACPAGDINCDTAVSVGDIAPFVLALTDPAGYATTFPDCLLQRADLNNDGVISVGDIAPLVALLIGK